MEKARFALKIIALAAALSVLPVGAAKYFTLFLTNGTDYYIDIWTADYSYAYLPPGGNLVIKTSGQDSDLSSQQTCPDNGNFPNLLFHVFLLLFSP